MEHNWDLYFDTSNPLWDKLQKIYKDNDGYPKVVTKGRNLHHKFMRSFSRLEGTPIDNDNDNLVSLSLPDHLRVHFYLYKCTKTGFRNRTAQPVRFMLKKALSYVTEETIEQIIEDWDYSFLYHGHPCSEETKRKISEANKGKVRTEDTRRKMSEAKKGKISEETRRKLSEANKGHYHSEESKKKISKALKGRKCKPVSSETRKKMSEAHKGHYPSEETLRKRSEALKGKSKGEKNGNFVTLSEVELNDIKVLGRCAWTKKYHHGAHVYNRIMKEFSNG